MSVQLSIEVRAEADRKLAKLLRRRAERMLTALRMSTAELSLVVCGDGSMRELNARYRGKDTPTDVLAFVQGETLAAPVLEQRVLGDVVISADTARRQAREAGRPTEAEATMLLAHGLLHLLGMDHRDRTEERRMVARTDLLIAAGTGAARPVGKAGARAPRRSGETGLSPRSHRKTI